MARTLVEWLCFRVFELVSMCRQLVGLAMLALASMGHLPLWMHQRVVHCCHPAGDLSGESCTQTPGCGASEPASVCSIERECCGELSEQATGDSDRAAAGFLQSPSTHDCAVCYQLSEPASPVGLSTVFACVFAVDGFLAIAEQRLAVTVDNSHPPRGPPTA